MNTFILIIAISSLLISIILLRKHAKNSVNKLLSLLLFCVTLTCFILLYGNIAGVIVTTALTLLTGLTISVVLGKPKYK
jgi:hypothetical protein